MGRSPCCAKEGLNRGAWTALEDKILSSYIKAHGEGKWRNLPKRAGLKRCGKSCRLRWLNYLRPDIKRGNISHDEEELIIRLHKLLGNRWSLIAGRLPGRTDNEIKNYWNTTLRKKAKGRLSQQNPHTKSRDPSKPKAPTGPQVIRTKASRCTRVLVPFDPPPTPPPFQFHSTTSTSIHPVHLQHHHDQIGFAVEPQNFDDLRAECESEVPHVMNRNNKTLIDLGGYEIEGRQGDSSMSPEPTLLFKDAWTADFLVEDNVALDLESLASLLNSEEFWP